MAYQRNQWHSGLTYTQTCPMCKTVVRYTDRALSFRPWYADGYVDCPKCKSHLRHNEKFAVNSGEAAPQVVPRKAEETTEESTERNLMFCTACGHKFGPQDRFCAMCGAPRK